MADFTGKGVAAERGAVLTQAEDGAMVLRQECTDREARSERLRDGHRVRLDAIVLVCEELAGATDARLDFVEQ